MRKKSKLRIDLVKYLEMLGDEIQLFESEILTFKKLERWKDCIKLRELQKATKLIIMLIKKQKWGSKNTATKIELIDLINDISKTQSVKLSISLKCEDFEACVGYEYQFEQLEYLLNTLDKFEKKK